MFPNLLLQTYKKQQGFLLPMALFIVVVLGGAAAIVSKKVSQSTASYILDAISIQTFYAAESGTQAGLHELFFTDTNRQTADARCAAMAIVQTLDVDGLKACAVTVSCSCVYENNTTCDSTDSNNYSGVAGVSHSFYTIDSLASCGVEPISAQHRIEIGASI